MVRAFVPGKRLMVISRFADGSSTPTSTPACRTASPAVALAGTIGENARANHDADIDAYAGIIAAPVALDVAIARAAELLTDATERALRLVLVGAALT